ncbi:MAG: acylphosphatase [Candidatus Altiarchaeota archaeon]|nr:acylphosphatase [Candidatus Altiarchaeota archaeon]
MTFAGNTDMDVQGVYLRQMIKEIADKTNIIGQVKNRRDGKVEVICDTDKKTADEFYEKIKNKADKERIKIKREECTPPTNKISEFNGFQIIREDDLKEMVWALIKRLGSRWLRTK